jgi:hypothetical protein
MISFEGILIGTGILWGLDAILVRPLTNYLLKQRLNSPTYAHLNGDLKTASEEPELKSLITRSYILVDTLVLGIAGFLFGTLLGWFFLGVSFNAKGWPGLIAFILMSIIGSSLKG